MHQEHVLSQHLHTTYKEVKRLNTKHLRKIKSVFDLEVSAIQRYKHTNTM